MGFAVTAVRLLVNGTSLVSPKLAGRQALLIFRYPTGRAKLREAERDVHQRAVTERFTINGKTIVSYRWGTGRRPVLLVHGWQSRASRFAAFVIALEELGYSPVSFDLPGHGDSTGRTTTILEYGEIITRLQAEYGDFESVIGHSFGVLAAFYAFGSGLRAKNFVALSGPSDFDYLVDEFCRQTGLTSRVRQELRRAMERLLSVETDDLWRLFDAKRNTDRVTIPILVIHDAQDAVVSLQQAELLKSAYGDQLELIATTTFGHGLLSRPGVVRDSLLFLTHPERQQPARPA